MEFGQVKRSTDELINAAVARQKQWMSRMRDRGKQLLKYLAKHSVKTVQTLVAVTPLVSKLQKNEEVASQSYWKKWAYLLSVFFVLALVACAVWLTFGGGMEKLRGTPTVEIETISEEVIEPMEEPAPAPEAEASPQPEPAAIETTRSSYGSGHMEVQPGDNLWNIAIQHFGDGMKYKILAEHNGITNPDRIYPGQVILIPAN